MTDPILSIQLYSGRNFPPIESQLAAVQRAGFTTVETFAPFYEDVPKTTRLLQTYGLSARSGHFSLAMAEGEPDRVVETAQALGMSFVVIPYLVPEDRPTGLAGWAAMGQRLKAVRDRIGTHGLRVAWHNHDFEFKTLEDGSWRIDHLLGDDLLWEADLAWIAKAEVDPVLWLDKYRSRVPLVHVKDIAADNGNGEDGWADVGTGIMVWDTLWPIAVKAGAEIMIAEHDNPSDFDRFARVSFAAMTRFMKGSAR